MAKLVLPQMNSDLIYKVAVGGQRIPPPLNDEATETCLDQ